MGKQEPTQQQLDIMNAISTNVAVSAGAVVPALDHDSHPLDYGILDCENLVGFCLDGSSHVVERVRQFPEIVVAHEIHLGIVVAVLDSLRSGNQLLNWV